jgi:hypothetical protein
MGVGFAPDLVVTEVRGPPSALPGSPFAATVTVCNQGTAPGGAPVDLVLSADPILRLPAPWEPPDPSADRPVGGAFFQDLPPGACQTQTVQGQAWPPMPGMDGAYYLGAVADSRRTLPELIETNNASPASLIGIGSGPDFVVKSVTGPPSALAGRNFLAAVTVCNQGTAPGIAGVDLVLSIDSTFRLAAPGEPKDAGDQPVGGDLFQLEPGACETRSVWGFAGPPPPAGDGAYYLGAVADLSSSLPELIESNNASPASLIGIGTRPDFVVTAVKGPPSALPGSPFTAAVTVCNQGTAPGGTPIDLVLSADSTIQGPPPQEPTDPTADRLVGGAFIPDLSPGACVTQNVKGSAAPPAPGMDGAYFLGAVADLPGSVPELIETNNTGPASLIGIGAQADFVVTAVKGPSSARLGSSFTSTVTVCNQGTAPGVARVDLVLSTDARLQAPTPWGPPDPSGARLVGSAGFSLSPGACGTQSVLGRAEPPPGASGPFYLGAIADVQGQLPELIETNNVGPARLIGIGTGPDLVVTAVKGPPSALPGGAFTASVTACNQGTAPGGASVDLVLSADEAFLPPAPDEPSGPAADQVVGGAFFQLQAGACATQTVQGQARLPAPGTDGAYHLGAVADLERTLPELIETNNASPATLIGVGVRPDFVVTAAKGPSSAPWGSLFPVKVTACNRGTASGSAQVDLVLSADAIIQVPPPWEPPDPAADRLVGGALFVLPAGACRTQTIMGRAEPPMAAAPGVSFLGAVADYPDDLPELIEGNNAKAGAAIGITAPYQTSLD